MAEELTLSGTATATLVGAWELRAGSHDTTEYLDGASDTTYPGGGPGTFSAVNSDGANGYDAAPKLALLTMTTSGNSCVAVTEGGGNGEGISSILSVSVSQRTGTASTAMPTLSHAVSSGEATLTLTSVGTGAGLFDVMVLYF